jgi:dUTP pyrophosphatase
MAKQYIWQNEANRTLNLCFDDVGVKSLYKDSTYNCDSVTDPYTTGMGDSGIDLFFPKDVLCEPNKTTKISLDVKCSVYNSSQQDIFENGCHNAKTIKTEYPPISQPFYVYPRSSIGKTPLRLANSVGIIDAQYRGNLIVQVDNISHEPYTIQRGQRLFQICSQDLSPFRMVKIVDSLLNTERGAKGIGSTGK